MAGTMGSYAIASSGMTAMQTALSVTTNNISNVDTAGYTRQSSIQSNTAWSNSYEGVGTGVEVQEIIQIRDKYVDERYRTELAAANAENAALVYSSEIESIIGRVSNEGLEDIIDPFFNAWESLSKDPGDAPARTLVYESGLALVETLNAADEELTELQAGINDELSATVTSINILTSEIAQLNEKIVAKYADNETPTDLLDERNVKLDELCALTGAKYFDSDNGSLTVYLDNAVLVNGNKSNEVELDIEASTKTPTLIWSESGSEIEVSSGYVEGLMRVGQDGTLQEARAYLDTLAETVATMVNAAHETGVGLEGSTGVSFFVTQNGYDSFTAGNISINVNLEDTNLIAASSSGSAGDNNIALEIAALRDTAGIADQAQRMVSWIADINSLSGSNLETTTLIWEQLSTQRESSMSVNLDEELSNLLLYQQAYNASAQVLQLLDELVDLVINRM